MQTIRSVHTHTIHCAYHFAYHVAVHPRRSNVFIASGGTPRALVRQEREHTVTSMAYLPETTVPVIPVSTCDWTVPATVPAVLRATVRA